MPYDELGTLTRSLRSLNPECLDCGSRSVLFYTKVGFKSIFVSKRIKLNCNRCLVLERRREFLKAKQRNVRLQLKFKNFAERKLKPYTELLEIEPETKLTVRHRVLCKNKTFLLQALIQCTRKLTAKCSICDFVHGFTLLSDKSKVDLKTVMYLVFICNKCRHIESVKKQREETRVRRKATSNIRKFLREVLTK